MATTNMNLSTQRISFVNKIGMILKATSDDEQPTQGYLYKEINAISFESVGYSESLVEFLVDRLKNKSCHVKFKVLKLMKHILEHGSSEFSLGLRKHSDTVKECTKFGGPPHPLHGNVPYVMVRKIAAEVCEALYKVDQLRPSLETHQKSPEPKYGGMGPGRSGGAIQGFGNTPASQNKGIGETILGEIEKLSTKISETPSDRQAALLAKLDLSGSVSNYQPPVVSCEDKYRVLSPSSAIDQTHNALTTSSDKKPVKKPKPGKAGGGWGDDDDDEEDDDGGSTSQISFEADSLADPALRLGPDDTTCDWLPETDLVTETIQEGSTGTLKAFLAPCELWKFRVKVANVNCDKVIEIISQKLASEDAGVVVRCLQLLEAIIYNPDELVGLELLTTTCRYALVSCYTQCGLHLQASQTKDDHNTSSNPELTSKSPKVLWSAVRAKCAKVILILQGLSTQKDILSPSNFAEFLPMTKSMTETLS